MIRPGRRYGRMSAEDVARIAADLRQIVELMKDTEEPLTPCEIEMCCNLGKNARISRLKRLMNAGIVEHEKVLRARGGKTVLVPTTRYRLSRRYLRDAVPFEPEKIAAGVPA